MGDFCLVPQPLQGAGQDLRPQAGLRGTWEGERGSGKSQDLGATTFLCQPPEPHPVMVGTPAALSWAGPSNPTMEPAQGLSLLAAKALEASTGLLVCGSRGQQPLGSSSRASCLSPAPSPVQGCTNCSQAGDGLCPPGEPRALVSDPGPVPARQEERP